MSGATSGVTIEPVPPGEFDRWRADLVVRFATLLPAGSSGRIGAAAADSVIAKDLPHGLATPATEVCWVVDGAERIGHLWLSYRAGSCVVHDVRLECPDRAAALLSLVLARARARPAHAVETWAVAGDPSHESFLAAGEFAPDATNLALTFAGPQPAPATVGLRPMSESEFARWQDRSVVEYAAARARNGESPEVARQVAEQQTAELFPDGLASTGQRLWVATGSTGERIGVLWIDASTPYAFVYNIEVDTQARGRGYGRAIMQAGAHIAQRDGSIGLALNVFGDNHIARNLYLSLGYVLTQGRYRMRLA